MTIPEKFIEQEGFRKLSCGALALYFFMLTLEERYGSAFLFSCERFCQELNISRPTFFKHRDELIKSGYIAMQSHREKDHNGNIKQKVKYFILED